MPSDLSEASLHQSKSYFGRFQRYLSEFVYGGIDGSVTTFAVVAGAEGANLSSAIVIIMGFANLIADGFAMSIGSYLSAKSEKDIYKRHEETEYWEIENLREREVEEVREIYRGYGFEGELLEKVVEVITSDKDRWVKVMMKEELELIPESKSPFSIGAATFVSFLLIGLIPLLSYLVDLFVPLQYNLFIISGVLTSLAFIIIGWIKTDVTKTGKVKGILETLALGIVAAVVAYFVGDLLEQLAT